jgi:hypothetical protein
VNDIFISYAHKDNLPFGEDGKSWVSDLHRDLETRLQQYRREPVQIWRDRKLAGTDVFGAEIETQLQAAELLVAVLSPRYLASEWCLRELESFMRSAERRGRLVVGNKYSVLKVVKLPIPRGELPAPLQATLGYGFFIEDRETGRIRELYLHPEQEIRRSYWAKVDDLAQDIANLLELRTSAAPPRRGNGAAIYLAWTTTDVQRERDALCRELLARGHQVLPASAPPFGAPELLAAVTADLARSRFSVHLIGARYGFVPEGEERSIVRLQHDLARAGHRPRIVWAPPGLQPLEEKQRAFLEAIQLDPPPLNGFEFLKTSVEELKAFVLDRLLQHRPESRESRPPGSPVQIYLICDQLDRDAVKPIETRLREEGLEVTLPVFKGDAARIREDHQETLKVCNAVLVYWGRGDDFWRRAKLRDLVRIRGLGRTTPFLTQAVWVADPSTEEKAGFATSEAAVVRDLDSFLDLLRNQGEGGA